MHTSGLGEVPKQNFSTSTKIFIVISSIFCNFLIQCLFYGSLTILKEFCTEHNLDDTDDTQILSVILPGVVLMSCSIYGFFLRESNNHWFTIVGSIVVTSSLVISSFLTEKTEFIVFFCIITGFGVGAIYVSSIIVILNVFAKYHGFIIAIVIASSETSFFIFEPISGKLISQYGWYGTNQLLGAVFLNCIAIGLIFRGQVNNEEDIQIQTNNTQRYAANRGSSGTCSYDSVEPSYIMQQIKIDKANEMFNSSGSLDDCMITIDNQIIQASEVNLNDTVMSKTATEYSSYCSNVNSEVTEMNKALHFFDFYLRKNHNKVSEQSVNYKYGNNVLRLSCNTNYKSFNVINPENRTGIFQSLISSTNFTEAKKLLKSPTLIIFTVSYVTSTIGLYPPMVFMPTFLLNEDVTFEQTTTVIKILMGFKICIKIPLGVLTSTTNFSSEILYVVILLMLSIALFVLPWLTTFGAFVTFAATTGSLVGSLSLLKLLLLHKMFGRDRFSLVLGLLSLFEGISSFIGPLLARLVDEKTETYSQLFSITASILLLSFFVSLPVRCFHRSEMNRQENAIEREIKREEKINI